MLSLFAMIALHFYKFGLAVFNTIAANTRNCLEKKGILPTRPRRLQGVSTVQEVIPVRETTPKVREPAEIHFVLE